MVPGRWSVLNRLHPSADRCNQTAPAAPRQPPPKKEKRKPQTISRLHVSQIVNFLISAHRWALFLLLSFSPFFGLIYFMSFSDRCPENATSCYAKIWFILFSSFPFPFSPFSLVLFAFFLIVGDTQVYG